MKRISRNLVMILSILLIANVVNAQQIDQRKMERDVKIAENILSSMIKEHPNLMFHSSSPKGTYVSEYGVILKIHGSVYYFNSRRGGEYGVISDDGNFTFDFDYRDNTLFLYDDEDDDNYDDEDDDDYDDVIIGKNKYKIKSKKRTEENRAKTKELLTLMMQDFLADYADLINQLEPNHKIMVVSGGTSSYSGFQLTRDKITVEVTRSDLVAHRSGKISREELLKRMKVTNSNNASNKETDLELFSTIFKRLYKPDLSETYYISSGMHYERLEGFGVIYNMRVYSSTSDHGRHKIVALNLDGLSREERDKKVAELYPEFEKGLKENILDYGKTIKSLGANESLMIKVKLTECDRCSMPRNVDVTVPQSVLVDYASGKLSKSAALSKISVKKYNN